MRIEVDQSIRIDNTQKDTILAFSNEISKAVRISASVKRKCLKILRSKDVAKKNMYLKLFATALFILLKSNAHRIDTITIDTEFSDERSQQIIKTTLLRNLRKSGSKISSDDITFRKIGKKSRAHEKAHSVHRGKINADCKIGTSELLKLI